MERNRAMWILPSKWNTRASILLLSAGEVCMECILCVSLGVFSKPSSFDDLYEWWFAASSGRDRKIFLIGTAALFWTIWKTRNKSCFQSIRPGDPTNVVYYLRQFLNDWALLQKSALRRVVQRGANKVMKVAHEVFSRRHGWGPDIPRLSKWDVMLAGWRSVLLLPHFVQHVIVALFSQRREFGQLWPVSGSGVL